MSRLPNIGGDDNQWGLILNDFLEVSHLADGTLKNSIVTNAKLDVPTQTTLSTVASKYTKPGPGIPVTDLTATVQASLAKADTSVSDHGSLTGLLDDSHTQYHTDTRGDIRYYLKAQVDAMIDGLSGSSNLTIDGGSPSSIYGGTVAIDGGAV